MDARSGILAAMSRKLLRHSFASLLHEGRSVISVARQLGHDARLTLGTLRA
jgi:site-specific recombinase XerD